ncbi:MAG: AarF/UbiB family protein [Geminicoccaceae bacterium]
MLESPRNLWRLVGIGRTLARHNALFPFELLPQARPLLRLARPFVNEAAPGRPGQRLAAALEELGPSFIKFGQSLATRTDLLGEAIARDLATLQDRCHPSGRGGPGGDRGGPRAAGRGPFRGLPGPAGRRGLDRPGAPGDDDRRRRGGGRVLRPGIEKAIERDLGFFAWLARLVERAQPHLRHYKPVEAVAIFAQVTRRELDLRLEAAAAVELGENARTTRAFACRRWTGGGPAAGWSPSSGSSARASPTAPR